MENLDNKDKTTLFFDVCAKIEGLCAQLYHYYSDVFQGDEDISKLWKKTALEEENHQKQFEFAFKLRNEVDFELKADLDWAYRIHGKLSTLLQHVRQNPPDIVTALNKAIEMEDVLADMHLDNSVRFQDESVRNMFKALSEFDQEHVKSLRHCLAIVTLHKTEMTG
jgi:rubrerythrin